jgi:hypothetical protein
MSWSRAVESNRYRWLSRRSYKLNEIAISFSGLANIIAMINEGISTLQALSSSDSSDKDFQNALSVRCLIECNHHHLQIVSIEDDDNLDCGLLSHYLRQNFRAVQEVSINTFSADTAHLIMDSLPNLTSVKWYSDIENFPLNPEAQIRLHPNIKAFDFDAWYYSVDTVRSIVTLLRACPNLTSLKCNGPWIFHGMNEILRSCSRIASLVLIYDCFDDQDEALCSLRSRSMAYSCKN